MIVDNTPHTHVNQLLLNLCCIEIRPGREGGGGWLKICPVNRYIVTIHFHLLVNHGDRQRTEEDRSCMGKIRRRIITLMILSLVTLLVMKTLSMVILLMKKMKMPTAT